MDKWQLLKNRRAILSGLVALGIAAMGMASFTGSASAQSLLEKIRNGETIRIGFSNQAPWAYPGENNEPLGFVNAMTLDILKKMGTTKVEPVVTEWGSLIPGLQAGRLDIITGGMYILPARCRNVLFTDPIVVVKDALIVPKGNPKGLHSYEDVRDKRVTLVTGSGYESVAIAQKVGVPDDKLMQVAGDVEIAQAVKVGRADAGSANYLSMKRVIENDDSLELADPFTSPKRPGYSALGFPLNEQATVDAFNTAMKDYLGSDEMMASVTKYGYDKTMLPDGTATAAICKE
ncbi:ectoine/hydroxyectoine ABC transporter substrate-binding protein EhuB [Mesorhizobium sp. M0040]|uniref:ectoine/hydroxyectoine ABC transporter substrate-binding protein EhuB n=1 Tax=Mesorhizobium sp. M0040 TaxID=2956855 RepID=UPI003337B634